MLLPVGCAPYSDAHTTQEVTVADSPNNHQAGLWDFRDPQTKRNDLAIAGVYSLLQELTQETNRVSGHTAKRGVAAISCRVQSGEQGGH